jgi:hypothetical protein
VRRTQVGGELQDGFGTVLLSEDAEAYQPEILGPEDDVRRTVTDLTTPLFIYTAAMQAEDFPEGYPASAFVVYQISAQVSRGFAGRFAFPDAPQLITLGEIIAEGQAGGASSAFEADLVMAQRYVAIGGRVLSASAYLGGGSGDMRIGLYADDAGEPGALLCASEIKAVTSTSSGHWGTFAFAPTEQVELVEGTHVWLAVHSSASINSRGSDGADQNDGRRLIGQAFASGLPDPFGAGSAYSNTRGMRLLVWTNPS